MRANFETLLKIEPREVLREGHRFPPPFWRVTHHEKNSLENRVVDRVMTLMASASVALHSLSVANADDIKLGNKNGEQYMFPGMTVNFLAAGHPSWPGLKNLKTLLVQIGGWLWIPEGRDAARKALDSMQTLWSNVPQLSELELELQPIESCHMAP